MTERHILREGTRAECEEAARSMFHYGHAGPPLIDRVEFRIEPEPEEARKGIW